MSNDTNKKQFFMNNVMIILFAQIAVKLLGVIYVLVITNIPGFGDAGNGYRSAGFNIYTLLLAISSVGIPNAISKMTSAKNAVGDYRGAYKIYKSALVLFSIVGVVASFLLFFGANFISTTIINLPDARYVIMALSPSIFFVCVSAVVRGYFVGMQDMKASSRSQVLEQVFKCVFTVGIVMLMAKFPLYPNDKNLNAAFMAAGANFATTLATVFSTIYIFGFYFKRKNEIQKKIALSPIEDDNKPLSSLFKSILLISIPISLGSIISAINRIVDTATITRGIEIAFATLIPAHGAVKQILNPTAKELTAEASRLAGLLSKSDTLLNLPIAMNISFATVLVPSISAALTKGEKKEASKFVSYSLLISILIIMPCAIGYISLGEPIYKLLYPNAPEGFGLLQLSSIALIFIALNQTISGSLQGIGKIYAPATGLFIGCIAKFILNVFLIRQPSINIYGAPISSIVCQVISFTYGFTVLSKNVSIKVGFTKYIIKPLGCAVIMGVSAIAIYKLMIMFTGNVIAVFAAIIIAALIYLASVIFMKILTEDEVQMLPFGNKIANILLKYNLLKK